MPVGNASTLVPDTKAAVLFASPADAEMSVRARFVGGGGVSSSFLMVIASGTGMFTSYLQNVLYW